MNLMRSIRVAVVTGRRIIAVAAHLFMFIIGFALPMLMAVKAREDRAASGIVAGNTRNIMIAHQRERMAEIRRNPSVDRVALLTIEGKV